MFANSNLVNSDQNFKQRWLRLFWWLVIVLRKLDQKMKQGDHQQQNDEGQLINIVTRQQYWSTHQHKQTPASNDQHRLVVLVFCTG